MPQEIRVLCCFKCYMYQVDIVKKSKKWQCKMCGEKQSVSKEFFRGTGHECRQRAQDLNLSANTMKIKAENQLLNLLDREDLEVDFNIIANEERKHQLAHNTENKLGNEFEKTESKWAKYVDDSVEKRNKSVEEEQLNNLKRKVDSNSEPIHTTKCLKPSTSASSKWSAYL